MHVMKNCNEGYMKILETIQVSEAYKGLKETYPIKLQESLYGLKQSRKKKVQKNDPNCPCIFMKRSW